MFCSNCGKKLADDAAFCEECGAKVERSMGEQSASPGGSPSDRKENANVAAKQLLSFVQQNRKAVLIAAGILAVIVAVAIFIATRPLTVRLDDYVTVEFTGYNTAGTASYNFDREKFCSDYAGKIDYQGTDPEYAFLDGQTLCEMLLEHIDGDLQESTGLSNGEEVAFIWDCENDIARENFDVKLSYSDLTFTVEGLKDAKVVSPLEQVELAYEGIAPHGEAVLVNQIDEAYANDLQFEIEPSTGLSNGDTITITLPQAETEDGRLYFLNTYGVTFAATERIITVEGLEIYASALSEVTEEALEEMKARGEDAMCAEAARRWDEEVSLDGVSYLGSYFLNAKDPDETNERNFLYLVFEVQSSVNYPEDGARGSVTYYYPVRFENLIVRPDGTISIDLDEYRTSGNSFRIEIEGERTHYLYYNGYTTMDDMFRELVASNMDRYTYETDITG